MSILTVLSTVYLFCLANYLVLEALDDWIDRKSAPMSPAVVLDQFGQLATRIQ